MLHRQPRVLDRLDPLEHDRAGPPHLAQAGEIFPRVRSAREDVREPGLTRHQEVVLRGCICGAGCFGEADAEDRVGEAVLAALPAQEGDVGVVQVGGTVAQGPGIEGDNAGGGEGKLDVSRCYCIGEMRVRECLEWLAGYGRWSGLWEFGSSLKRETRSCKGTMGVDSALWGDTYSTE